MMTGARLTSRQKAAVIVRLLLAEGEDISLEAVPKELQGALADAMADMSLIDQTTRDTVVDEFCEALSAIGLAFPGGVDGTLDMLSGRISHDVSDRLRRLAVLSGQSDPWQRIAGLSVTQLCRLARSESAEIAAVMFARLPVEKAAEAFARLDAGRARRIAYAMSLTGNIEAPALSRIGRALVLAADMLPRPVLDSAPVEKVGALLNSSPAATRDSVLDGLDQDDQAFALGVRRTIFAWEHIPARIEPRDVPRIVRLADQQVLIRAMAGARDNDAPTVEFILGALSTRMGDALRDEIGMAGEVSQSDAEAAMAEVVATIREMEAAGDLSLIAVEDTTEDDEQIGT